MSLPGSIIKATKRSGENISTGVIASSRRYHEKADADSGYGAGDIV